MNVKGKDNYHNLMKATEKLIKEKGCKNTTLKDITEESGLSKGGIYHYVKSKNELYALILKERLQKINEQFFATINFESPELEKPLKSIVNHSHHIINPDDMTNHILIYLLGNMDDDEVRNMLEEFYKISVEQSIHWIKTGQKGGVISNDLDAEKIAEFFVIISYGIRVRHIIAGKSSPFLTEDYFDMMKNILKP